jgi:hypothetical protein
MKLSGGRKVPVHQREGVVGQAGADAGDQRARQHHDEDQRHQPVAEAPCESRRWRHGRACCSMPSPVQNIRPKSRKARPRWAASRYCETRGSSTRPLLTMYQPIAPCRPPRMKKPNTLPPARRAAGRAAGTRGRAEEHHADQAAGQAVRPFPPEDELEAVQRHVVIDASGTPASAGTWRRVPASAASDSGGRAPISGFHSTMERPGVGQARHAADHHGDENHGAAGEQPPGHGALRIACRIHSDFQCPDLPPAFSSRRMSSMTMPRSAALHMS